jgi:urease accessory protein
MTNLGREARPSAVGVSVMLLAMSPAQAHLLDEATLGPMGPFVAGLSHPVLGFDHFLAMFSVGVVSAVLGREHLWRVPAAFLAGMPAGWLLGWAQAPFPAVETGIALSVVLLGLGALAAKRIPMGVIYLAVVAFALCHGYAHGRETPAGVDLMHYAAGFMAGTAAIHVLGVLIGQLLSAGSNAWPLRFFASAVALCGVSFLAVAHL